MVELAKLEEIELVTDTQTLVFAFFHMSKMDKDHKAVKDRIAKLMRYVGVTSLSKEALAAALAVGKLADLEDAAQLEIAREIAADVFVTRDLDVYKKSSFPVKSPAQFLSEFSRP